MRMAVTITPELEKIFWQNVKRQKRDQCWEWTGNVGKGRNGNDYGLFQRGLAHRFSWLIHKQTPPSDKAYIRHTCDSSTCVNPAHLIEVPTARMTDKVFVELRGLYRTGAYSYQALAKRFSLPIKMVYAAIQQH